MPELQPLQGSRERPCAPHATHQPWSQGPRPLASSTPESLAPFSVLTETLFLEHGAIFDMFSRARSAIDGWAITFASQLLRSHSGPAVSLGLRTAEYRHRIAQYKAMTLIQLSPYLVLHLDHPQDFVQRVEGFASFLHGLLAHSQWPYLELEHSLVAGTTFESSPNTPSLALRYEALVEALTSSILREQHKLLPQCGITTTSC
jgi:hypothetical protein